MTCGENTHDLVTAHEHEGRRGVPEPDSQIARVSVLFGPNAGQTYTVTHELTMGRSGQADLCLNDRGVSRLHARLRRLPGDRFVLDDLSSRNGTLVGGLRIASTEIRTGARIQLGPRCLLLFSVHDELEESLLQTKKMEIIGRLSAGINHDFNNLLCVVMANAAYLLELPPSLTLAHAEVRECLEDMRSAAQAGAELTSRLATLVQGGPLVHESVDVSKLCEDLVSVLRNTLPRGVRVESRVQPGIRVRGVRSHLWQMLLNPALNARDAMPDGGTLTIELVREAATELDDRPQVHADSYAVITFDDCGAGMSDEVLKAAFEPFFTTREIDLGRGLGLATVRKVASDHGGTVALSSRPGAGTKLRLVLPLMELPGEEMTPAADASRRRVLVVEADRALARAFGRALRSDDVDVLWAQDSVDAIALFEAHGSSIDVVLIDADASRSALHDLQATVRAHSPTLPFVMLTDAHEPANSMPPAGSMPADGDGVEIRLRKPIDLAMLTRVISQAARRRGKKP